MLSWGAMVTLCSTWAVGVPLYSGNLFKADTACCLGESHDYSLVAHEQWESPCTVETSLKRMPLRNAWRAWSSLIDLVPIQSSVTFHPMISGHLSNQEKCPHLRVPKVEVCVTSTSGWKILISYLLWFQDWYILVLSPSIGFADVKILGNANTTFWLMLYNSQECVSFW